MEYLNIDGKRDLANKLSPWVSLYKPTQCFDQMVASIAKQLEQHNEKLKTVRKRNEEKRDKTKDYINIILCEFF